MSGPAGVTQLAYLAFEVVDFAAFDAFLTDVLGLVRGAPIPAPLPGPVGAKEGAGDAPEASQGPPYRLDEHAAHPYRLDERAARFFVSEGPANDLVAVGFEVESLTTLVALEARLLAGGVETRRASRSEADARRVEAMSFCRDPFGHPLELVVGPEVGATPFASPLVPGGFVAGPLGAGHVVLAADDPAKSLAFYTDLLGFRFSDRVATTFYGHTVDLAFLHCNPRHHTLALGAPMGKRLHHFLVECRDLDAVGAGFDRALRQGIRIANGLGRHPNDRMFSFYARTPAGFQFEYGFGGRLIEDDSPWQPEVYDRISDWGHHPPSARPKT